MITITELEDEIIKNKEAAAIFIEKINDKKNEIHEKMKHPWIKLLTMKQRNCSLHAMRQLRSLRLCQSGSTINRGRAF